MTVTVKVLIPAKTAENTQTTQYTATGLTAIIDKMTATNYSAAAATISVKNTTFMSIANAAPTTITNFDDGYEGQVITLTFADANTTIDRSNAYLAGGVNFVSSANDLLTLRKIGVAWYEVCRSVNA